MPNFTRKEWAVLGSLVAVMFGCIVFLAISLNQLLTPENIGEAAGRIAKSYNETVKE